MAQNKTQQHFKLIDLNTKIIEKIDNGIIVVDNELSILHYNKWLELHTGLKEKDLLNLKIDTIFPSIKSKTLLRKIKTALTINSPTFYSASATQYLIPITIHQIKNSAFEYMQQDISIIPLDIEKKLVALVITDQTNMANTHAKLEYNIEKINELNAELLKEKKTIDKRILFIKFDCDGQIYTISKAFLELLKYKKSDLLEKNFFQYNKDTFSAELKNELLKHMKEKTIYTFELQLLNHKSKEIWLKSSLVPEFDSKGIHIGFILFHENITDAKTLEKNREEMLMHSRSSAMGEMIAMIAHQWRQPLSLISTVIATLKIKHELQLLDQKTMQESFEKIETTTSYLSQTIDDFRAYFKPDKLCSDVNVYSLFDQSIFFLQDEMKQLKIKFDIHIDKEIVIKTYKNELLHTLINIVKNSVDAFKEQPDIQDKQLFVSVTTHHDTVLISIEDNAGGIESEVLKKVFEPYFSTKSKNGTGLGLYTAHAIVTEHLHGEIMMYSKESITTTIIKLPFNIQTKTT